MSERMKDQTHTAHQYAFPTSQSPAARRHSPSEEAIAHIQDILEEDEVETSSPCSLHDLVALHTKTSEFAAILKEDSSSLSLNWAPSAQHHIPKQHPAPYAEPPQFTGFDLASLPRSSTTPVANHVVFWNTLTTSQSPHRMPASKVLDIAAFRSLLSIPPAPCEEGNAEASVVDKHLHDVRTPTVKDLSFSKPRRCKFDGIVKDEVLDMGLHNAGLPANIYLQDMLLQCAHSIGMNHIGSAMAVVHRVKQQTSPYGNAAERLAYYFVKALHARFEGTGWSLYTGHLSQPRPFPRRILESSFKYMSSCPFAKASHFFANQTILRVAKRAVILHIIDHQMTGIQYPSLFKELAALPGGPPKVFLVGLVVRHYSMPSAQSEVIKTALEETGRRLSKCAESFSISFHFTPWVGTREKMRLQEFVSSKRSPDEMLVLISACLLRFVMDDILDPRPVRLRILKMVYDVEPDVYIQGIVSGSYGNPFYLPRFKEALFHFACMYDVLDTFSSRDNQDRIVFESEVLGKAILNVVACEGQLVSERVEKYKQWQRETIEEAGVQQLHLGKDMVHKVQVLLQRWHKDYVAAEDRQYLLMGWKGRVLYALSAWKSPARPG
ncbi:hypothetical protein L7F22_022858 [Adiantum nelumboides]|nr:hypothetical protein [Adiantum nelumboides]